MPAGRGGHGGPFGRRCGEVLAVNAVEAEDRVRVQGFRVQRERDGECCGWHVGGESDYSSGDCIDKWSKRRVSGRDEAAEVKDRSSANVGSRASRV